MISQQRVEISEDKGDRETWRQRDEGDRKTGRLEKFPFFTMCYQGGLHCHLVTPLPAVSAEDVPSFARLSSCPLKSGTKFGSGIPGKDFGPFFKAISDAVSGSTCVSDVSNDSPTALEV